METAVDEKASTPVSEPQEKLTDEPTSVQPPTDEAHNSTTINDANVETKHEQHESSQQNTTNHKDQEQPSMVNQHQVDQNTPTDHETQSLAIGVETVATTIQHPDANIQRTLAIIKPDAMQANKKGTILDKIDESNFIIVKERELHLTKEQAGLFYREHEGKPFYVELTTWMSR